MKLSYTTTKGVYGASLGGLTYHHLANGASTEKRRLLLLHGVRFSGLETWGGIIRDLNAWSDILLPDLPGVGLSNPVNKSVSDFNLNDILHFLEELVNKHAWENFYIAGYSYGGFLSMMLNKRLGGRISNHFTIEPVLFLNTSDPLSSAASKLKQVACMAITDPAEANSLFLGLSKRKKESLSLKLNARPIRNPLGFANLLNILADAYLGEDIDEIIRSQGSMTTLITEYASTKRRSTLEELKQLYSWHIVSVKGADHSVSFTHSGEVAKLMNDWLVE